MEDSPIERNLHLCTLFDSKYLAQGLALIESVERTTNANIYWTVLALDQKAAVKLVSLSKSNIEVIELLNFPDLELRGLIGQRPWREICWTSASCLLSYCIDQSLPVDFVGYVDADCFFFGDIDNMLTGIPHDKSIAIHEHNFSSDRREWLQKSGRFNVGVVIGRPDVHFSDCIRNWRRQVLSKCTVDFEAGECGDQTYLNEWPSRYPAVHIFSSKGAGVAPWNLNNYRVSIQNEMLAVDEEELYFFHFHGLQVHYFTRFLVFYVAASGYNLLAPPIKTIYMPYVSSTLRAAIFANLTLRDLNSTRNFSWILRNFLNGRLRIFIRKFKE